MRKLFLIAALVMLSSNSAYALSCLRLEDADAVSSASSIFVGKVLNVDSQSVTFEISKYWKGSLSQKHTILGTTYWTGSPGGDIFYSLNKEYIVYTYKNTNGIERSSIDCGRTQKYSKEAELRVTNILGLPKFYSTTGDNSKSYCANTNKLYSNLWYRNFQNNREQVLLLQNFLFGYYNIANEVTATGYFGRLTSSYVSKFQREMGIRVSGGVGPITRQKINDVCNGRIENDDGNSANCKVWFDGCNTCSRSVPGGMQMCTLMACIQGGDAAWFAAHKPMCREYFR